MSLYFQFFKYFRYIESGCYRGFLKQVGLQQIASELNLETNNTLLWQVYTDADFKARLKHKYSTKLLSKKPGMLQNQLVLCKHNSMLCQHNNMLCQHNKIYFLLF